MRRFKIQQMGTDLLQILWSRELVRNHIYCGIGRTHKTGREGHKIQFRKYVKAFKLWTKWTISVGLIISKNVVNRIQIYKSMSGSIIYFVMQLNKVVITVIWSTLLDNRTMMMKYKGSMMKHPYLSDDLSANLNKK